MTSYVKRVGDLTDPENFEKTVVEANKNGKLDDFDTDWVDCAMLDTSAELERFESRALRFRLCDKARALCRPHRH